MESTGKNRVNVTIYGKEYTIVGEESAQYISKIAEKVDETIAKAGGSTVNLSMKLIFAALNLADETEKAQEEVLRLKKLLEILEEKNEILQRNLNSIRGENKFSEEQND